MDMMLSTFAKERNPVRFWIRWQRIAKIPLESVQNGGELFAKTNERTGSIVLRANLSKKNRG